MPEPNGEKSVGMTNDGLQQAAQEKTATPPLQRYRSTLLKVALSLAVITFALLTFLVETIPSFQIDLQITQAIQSLASPFFTAFMRLVSWPGYLPQSVIITLLIAGAIYRSGLHWESVACLLASLVSGATNQLAKTLIQRPRPTGDLVDVFTILESYSFPSGHVMFYTILFGFVWYLVYTLLEPSLPRHLLLGLFGSFILLVGVSRIYLGQHWASDVLGAYLLGALTLAGMILVYQWGKTRFFVHQPVAPPDPKEQ
jgi:undecaprenyl-diphosphatase